MFDCALHGVGQMVHCCRHVDAAVDLRTPIPVLARVGYGEVFVVCAPCASSVDQERGFSSATGDSEVGMELHAAHVVCFECAAETYHGVMRPDFKAWVMWQCSRPYAEGRS